MQSSAEAVYVLYNMLYETTFLESAFDDRGCCSQAIYTEFRSPYGAGYPVTMPDSFGDFLFVENDRTEAPATHAIALVLM